MPPEIFTLVLRGKLELVRLAEIFKSLDERQGGVLLDVRAATLVVGRFDFLLFPSLDEGTSLPQRMAFVVDSDLQFGIARMIAAYVASSEIRVYVEDDIASATTFLESRGG